MGGKNKSVTVGYWYYTDVLATLCHSGPDDDIELMEVQVGERTAWTGSVTESKTISVVARDLFGGEKREGGVEGNIDVMMGEPSMSVNSFLGASMRASGITGPVPAYRRVLSLFFRGGATDPEFEPSPEFTRITSMPPKLPPPGVDVVPYIPPAFRWTALNPYFKPFRVKLRRSWRGWYPTRAKIGRDANPAHIIFECFTNPEWGMGYPVADLDDARFRSVADRLYAENFGLSLKWTQQTSIEDFVKMILQHINGVICQDRVTGQLFPKLVREDYDPEDLIELNPTNCILEGYSRPGFGETVNEVVLKYTTRNGETDAVTVQDLAGITSQGQVVNQTIEMPGICDPELAARVAQRELESRTKPISKLTIIAGRAAYPLYEGDVFKFSWPAHGIVEAYYRVVTIGLGRLEDNSMQIEAVEDVFGLPNASYAKPQPIGWVDTSQPPEPATVQRAEEATYHDVITQTSEADRAYFEEGFGFGVMMAVKPQTDTMRYQLHYSPNNSNYEQLEDGTWTPSATLTSDIGYTTTVFTVENAVGLFQVPYGALAYLGDEQVQVVSIDGSTVTVKRGVIDTTPKAHPAGTRLWVFDELLCGRDTDLKVEGETAYYKPVTVSSQAVLPVASATASSVTFANRFERPYPPGQLRINGIDYPVNVEGTPLITWAHRDRVQQADQVIDTTSGSIGPEPGTEYRVRVYNGTTLVRTYSGIIGTSQVYSLADAVADNFIASPRFVIHSQRDGLDSWQAQDITVTQFGLGYQLGESLGGYEP